MYNRQLSVLLFAVPVLLQAQGPQSIQVNEVMASNASTVQAPQGSEEDWVELYNPGSNAVDLTGWWISDDATQPHKHALLGPGGELVVPAHGFLLLWADNATALGPRHLGFGLSASGDLVYLTAPDGTTVDAVSFGAQTTDISYGRMTDGAGIFRYFATPTPGASNNTSTPFLGVLQPPVFSVASGFRPAAFQTSITSPDAGVQIIWTKDGSTPSVDLLSGQVYTHKDRYQEYPVDPPYPMRHDTLHAYNYSGPIAVTAPAAGSNELCLRTSSITSSSPPPYAPFTLMRKATVLRARAFKAGWVPSPTVMATYFITPGGINPYQLPIVSLGIDKPSLFGYDQGLYTPGTDFDQWRQQNPTLVANYLAAGNWDRSSEFPLSMQFIEDHATTVARSLNAGFRLHGGASRGAPRKSMRLYFRGEYGSSDLDYPIFQGLADTEYKRLMLHNSGNDEQFTNMRDMCMQALCRHMRHTTQEARPAVLFINGEAWGVNPVRSRYDRHDLERRFGIQEGELDLLENNALVEEGDAVHYTELFNYVGDHGMTQPEDLAFVTERVDIDNMIDYMAGEIFMVNGDWPHNNVRFFRKRTAAYEPNAPYGQDGRWRWLMYDTDFGFGGHPGYQADHNMLAWAVAQNGNTNGEWCTRLFRRMMLNTTYRNTFINRYADLMNTAFLPAVTAEIINAHRALMAPDMQEHFERWRGRPGSASTWNGYVDAMVQFGVDRPAFARAEVLDVCQLPAHHVLTLNVSGPDHGYVHVNTIDIRSTTHGVPMDPYPWSGTYFQGVPITLTAQALPGHAFSHWEGAVTGTAPTITVDMTTAMSITAVFVEGVLCPEELVHQWHFNDASGANLTEVPADLSIVGGARITYPGSGAGYMDPTNAQEGTTLNAPTGIPSGRALRARNPSDARVLLIEAPSTGHRELTLSFATMRTNNGAQEQTVAWSTDQTTWHDLAPAQAVGTDWELRTYDLNGVAGTYDAPSLVFRITFTGSNASGTSGNDRFDNIRLTGHPVQAQHHTLCAGDTYTQDGITYDTPGTYLHPVEGPMDCGHVEVLHLAEVAPDTTVTFASGTLTVAEGGAQYQWTDCDGTVLEGATAQTFTPPTNGTYAVEVTIGDCTLGSGCHMVTGMGVATTEADLFRLYPNPTSGLVVVERSTATRSPWRLLDAYGRLVRSGTLEGLRGTLDLEGLAPGTYGLHWTDDPQRVALIIKQ